jgi:hypothetical protein
MKKRKPPTKKERQWLDRIYGPREDRRYPARGDKLTFCPACGWCVFNGSECFVCDYFVPGSLSPAVEKQRQIRILEKAARKDKGNLVAASIVGVCLVLLVAVGLWQMIGRTLETVTP